MRGGRVVVVGGGLAGLACAIRLTRAGREVALLEASDGVGGRVRTDHVAGFMLDRGFQVYLSGYPRAGELLDLEGLELRPFEPGALVRVEDAFHEVGDPWRRPSGLVRTIRAPVGTLADKLRVGRLRHRLRAVPVDALFERPERTTRTELERLGFSPRMIDRFFRPFLGGVFLDPGLVTSSRMFEFVFRMFAEGDATVPAGGMERIPRQLAASLPGDVIRTGVRVVGREGTVAVTSGGTRVEGEALVVATDGSTAARLVPGLEGPAWRGVHTLYFAAEEPPIRRPILVLNGSGRGLVNNLSVLSEVAPEYAPAGASLISVSVIKADGLEGSRLVAAVREELGDWFGSQVVGWRHLQTYRIPEALPAQLPPGHGPRAVRVRDLPGVYVCGDHRWTASIEGAISSGLQAAAAVLEDLDSSPPTSS